MSDVIRAVDLTNTDPITFKKAFADCIVLTKDGKLLLQQRPQDWYTSAGCLTAFGGHIEDGETPLQALIRELHEELGAIVKPEDVIALDAITESFTDHTEIVYGHFWHDKEDTITGCYECEAVTYEKIADALKHPKIMEYVVWFLKDCQTRKLLA